MPVTNIPNIVREPDHSIRILRVPTPTADALRLLEEYYEAVHVVQRDTLDTIQQIITGPTSGLWLAYLDEEPVGCVVLKNLASIPLFAECKRLYVQPSARGHRIAAKLLDAKEAFAHTQGL